MGLSRPQPLVVPAGAGASGSNHHAPGPASAPWCQTSKMLTRQAESEGGARQKFPEPVRGGGQ